MDRIQIKKKARESFYKNYWPSVGVFVIISLLSFCLSMIPVIGWLLAIFVSTIIMVGKCIASTGLYNGGKPEINQIFMPFSRYGRVLGGMLWMILWLVIWSLIFLIPYIVIMMVAGIGAFMSSTWITFGANAAEWSSTTFFVIIAIFLTIALAIPMIIKSISYSGTPYILGLFPNVGATDALNLSKKIMQGQKGKFFVMGLSFLGWAIIPYAIALILMMVMPFMSVMWSTTGMILFYAMGAFFLVPYASASFAGFFDNAKNEAIANGTITIGMLEGAEKTD